MTAGMEKETLKIAVVSGKGGIGKSVISANLGFILSKKEIQTVLFDADTQFPNLHLLQGIEPPVRLSQYYAGQVDIDRVIFKVRDNLNLLADMPAAGLAENYSKSMIINAYADLLFHNDPDIVIFDAPSGAGDEVLQVCNIADIIAVVINDEPTSLLDAYGLIKILREDGMDEKVRIIVNNVIDFEDAEDLSKKLNRATKKFLKNNYDSLGFIPYNRNVRQFIIKQELITKNDPEEDVSKAIEKIGNNLINNYILSEISNR